ncbi:ErfK/YbiS/YcfS/YnhG family protein [Enhydrobacter aerosaccus SK60]|nr:ErfK/YbiS/YcfS/YnhG family protein [Enhydrobacter aerosaccus SK60]
MLFGMLILVILFAWLYFLGLPKPEKIVKANNSDKPTMNYLAQNKIYADKVYVKKSARIMQLLHNNSVIREYNIALGDNPKGHKQQEGDERTPEGWYTLDWANEQSAAYRSLHVSYPNSKDRANAKMLGVSPGGAIMIHGQMNGTELLTAFNQKRDWTNGCIAVTNSEMDEIMTLVKVGTPIFIEW